MTVFSRAFPGGHLAMRGLREGAAVLVANTPIGDAPRATGRLPMPMRPSDGCTGTLCEGVGCAGKSSVLVE